MLESWNLHQGITKPYPVPGRGAGGTMVPSLVQTLLGGQVKWQLSEHDPVSELLGPARDAQRIPSVNL